jgi:ArsR family transcriptional regulator
VAGTKRKALSADQIRAISKALADPRRHEILKQIGKKKCPLACQDVREHQGISAATLSHHIKELERAGLISITREGKFANLSVERDTLQAYIEHLEMI